MFSRAPCCQSKLSRFLLFASLLLLLLLINMATTKMVGASHTIRVKTLYRHALKNLQNWTVWREMFIEKGFELRAQFDAQKKLTDPKMIEEVVSKAEAKLAELKHPDPYTSARRVHPHRKRARTTAAFLLFSPQRGPALSALTLCACGRLLAQSRRCRAAANTSAIRSTAQASRRR